MQSQVSTFGGRLLMAAKLRGLKKVELARALGLSPSAITQWVTGETKRYKAENVRKAAEVLRVRYEWLLDGDGPMETADVHDAAGELFELLPPNEAQAAADFIEFQLRRSLADDPGKLGSYLRMIDRIRNAKK